jgi:hypothetical protein
MKKQYLTEIQKEVLLEMCRVMFPEIESEKIKWYSDENEKRITIDHSEECEEFIIFNAYPEQHTATKKWDTVSIHWCDLCFGELANKILNIEFNKLTLLNMIQSHILGNRHVVDFLYEQFKRKQ